MSTALTPARIAVALLLALMVVGLAVGGAASVVGLVAYYGVVAVTMAVVTSVRKEPGSWLGRRRVRRAIVALLLAVCVCVLAIPPPMPNGASYGALLGLFMLIVLLNIALGRATQRVANAPEAMIDERQLALRDRAHRIAYVALAAAVGGVMLVADIASAQSRAWLGETVRASGWLVFFELLFFLPTMVLACIEPDRIEMEAGETPLGTVTGQRAAAALLVVSFATPVALSIALAIVPPSVSISAPGSLLSTTSASDAPPPGLACRHFQADVTAGRGVQAEIPVNAVACWNGTKATASYGMGSSDCNPGSYSAVQVTTLSCSSKTLSDGTLTFRYQALVSSAVVPFLAHAVTVEVSIDKDGRVLDFP